MKIELPPKAWLQAQKYQETVLEALANRKAGPNYTKLHASNRFAFGYLGERAFKEALLAAGKKFEWHLDTSGFSSAEDLSVWNEKGYWKSVDVKTASKPHHRHLMIPERQRPRALKHNFMVAARIATAMPEDGNTIPVVLEGVCTSKRIKAAPIIEGGTELEIPTIRIPFTELNPVEDWIAFLLDDGEDPFAARYKSGLPGG